MRADFKICMEELSYDAGNIRTVPVSIGGTSWLPKYPQERIIKDWEVVRLMDRFSEKDWKLFRSKIADWQEVYMDKLNKEYLEDFSDDLKDTIRYFAGR